MPEVTLVTGGGRSGKSAYAVERARRYARRAFIATAEPVDAEMEARIAAHQRERFGMFETIEAPLELAPAVRALESTGCEVAVIDCLTVWMGNLLHHIGRGPRMESAIAAFLDALAAPPCELIVVTNEVGMGIIPDNALAREFRDLAGSVNARVARVAQRVVLTVAGIPLVIKGAP